MLDGSKQQQLTALLEGLSRDQMIWVSGYIQGKTGVDAALGVPAVQEVEKPPVFIYYATETGNSKALSLQVMKACKQAGFKAKNVAVNRLKLETITPDQIALFIVSTHGEGDPPESAVAFFDAVKALPDGAISGLNYAMLGLGDSSYEIFCGAATALDSELARLGAKSFQDIRLLDVDYATHTPDWIDATMQALNARYEAKVVTPIETQLDAMAELRTGKGYSRLEPVEAVVKDIINLNDHGSAKETYHIELECAEPLHYTPGDALGIMLPKDAGGKDQTPRLYSIASSPAYHEGEIHLTVALAKHTLEDGSMGFGVASKFLADQQPGDHVQVYISQNQLFNLPADDQDAIMIGPGTGIAPFRSFVYERAERGASGRNWVLFGDQHAHCDFLYQAEWQEHLATEALHRLDLAFSRDQAEKIYVQDRLRAEADRLIEWVDQGAAIYVCGAKDPMSRDVERTLIELFAEKKALAPEAAIDFLGELEEQGRYVKDVY